MAYLGASPLASFASPSKDTFSGDNSTTSFTMGQSVGDPNQIEVFVDNVRQEPTSAPCVSKPLGAPSGADGGLRHVGGTVHLHALGRAVPQGLSGRTHRPRASGDLGGGKHAGPGRRFRARPHAFEEHGYLRHHPAPGRPPHSDRRRRDAAPGRRGLRPAPEQFLGLDRRRLHDPDPVGEPYPPDHRRNAQTARRADRYLPGRRPHAG